MKKLILIIPMAIMSRTIAFAENGNSIHNAISKQLKTSSLFKKQQFNEKVNVQFKIDATGTVSILNVATHNPEVKNYITYQFNKIDFSSIKEGKEMIYNININFKTM
jgi:hypothetical protein